MGPSLHYDGSPIGDRGRRSTRCGVGFHSHSHRRQQEAPGAASVLPMLISGRAAAFRLESAGLHRRQARRLLATGFAGTPIRTTSALLFDACRIDDLVRWPLADQAELDEQCPWGIFIARRDVDVLASRAEQLATVHGDWPLNMITRVYLEGRIREHGFFPFVATVCGYVALGAEIVGGRVQEGHAVLDLRDPGEWFDELRYRRLPSGPGRPWVIRGWQPFARMGQSRT